MAKVIGAEGQRNLNYALRREEEKKRSQDSANARQRMALANNLSKLSMDPDIDDPKLAYLGAAAMADPTGLMGGIASGLGAIAQVKAMNTKRDALKSKKEASADDAVVQMGEIYGQDATDGILESLDPSGDKRKDPAWVNKTMGMLEEREQRQRDLKNQEMSDTLNALNISTKTADIATKGLQQELDILTLDKARTEMAEREEAKNQWEQMKPGIETAMIDLGVAPDQAKFLANDKQFATNFFNKEIVQNLDDGRRRKMYQSDPFLKEAFPSEDMFLNAKNYPPEVVTHLLGEMSARPMFGTAQGLQIDLARNLNLMREIQGPARINSINQLYPYADANGKETQEFKEWYVNHAQTTLGLEPDEFDDDDDPLDQKYNELMTMDQKANGQSAIAERLATYQGGLIQEDKDSEARISALMQSDGTYGALMNNIATGRSSLQNLFQQYPSLRGSVQPRPVQFDEQILSFKPGTIFQKANGGFYITVGGGDNKFSGVSGWNLGVNSQRHFHDRNKGQMNTVEQPLNGADSINVELLNRGKVNYTPLQGGSNRGYRELTAEESQELLPLLQGMMTVPSIATQGAQLQGDAGYVDSLPR